MFFPYANRKFYCTLCKREVEHESLSIIREKFKKSQVACGFFGIIKKFFGMKLSDDQVKTVLTKGELFENLRKGQYKNIVVLTGAGISVNAGIPDFRSPGTGLYSQLKKYKLPFPEAVFSIEYFKKKPEPFFMLASMMFAKKYLPTIAHYFIRFLQDKGLLLRNYTQNIDNLECEAGLRKELLIQAHGTYTTSHCAKCEKEVDSELMMKHIEKGEPMKCPSCGGPCKPDIVFFGEGLPSRFFAYTGELKKKCDLIIVIGTSMVVQPFCSLPKNVPDSVPRLIINNELPSMFDQENGRDVFLEGDCDSKILKLVKAVGWQEEFDLLLKEREEYATRNSIPFPK